MPAKYLVQDIETVPETEIDANWTREQREKDPFPPIQYHKVACIGMLVLDENFEPIKSGCAADGLQSGQPEDIMLRSWAKVASGEATKTGPLTLVDWHGRGFDVPVMQTRAFRYGIQLPWYFGKLPDNKGGYSSWSKDYRDRYGGSHMDLADWWCNKGSFRRPHLADMAMLMGLPGKVGIDGSQVHEAYKDGLYADIDIYCMQDVYQTGFILQRCQYMAGNIDLEDYRQATQRLIQEVMRAPGQGEFRQQIQDDVLLLGGV